LQEPEINWRTNLCTLTRVQNFFIVQYDIESNLNRIPAFRILYMETRVHWDCEITRWWRVLSTHRKRSADLKINCVARDVTLWLTFAFCPKWSNSQKQASSHARELRPHRRSVVSEIWLSKTRSLYVRSWSTATRKSPVEAYTFLLNKKCIHNIPSL